MVSLIYVVIIITCVTYYIKSLLIHYCDLANTGLNLATCLLPEWQCSKLVCQMLFWIYWDSAFPRNLLTSRYIYKEGTFVLLILKRLIFVYFAFTVIVTCYWINWSECELRSSCFPFFLCLPYREMKHRQTSYTGKIWSSLWGREG